MDASVISVAMAALVADGILAGLSLDKVIVQLPARRRIGVIATEPLWEGLAKRLAKPLMFVGRTAQLTSERSAEEGGEQ